MPPASPRAEASPQPPEETAALLQPAAASPRPPASPQPEQRSVIELRPMPSDPPGQSTGPGATTSFFNPLWVAQRLGWAQQEPDPKAVEMSFTFDMLQHLPPTPRQDLERASTTAHYAEDESASLLGAGPEQGSTASLPASSAATTAAAESAQPSHGAIEITPAGIDGSSATAAAAGGPAAASGVAERGAGLSRRRAGGPDPGPGAAAGGPQGSSSFTASFLTPQDLFNIVTFESFGPVRGTERAQMTDQFRRMERRTRLMLCGLVTVSWILLIFLFVVVGIRYGARGGRALDDDGGDNLPGPGWSDNGNPDLHAFSW